MHPHPTPTRLPRWTPGAGCVAPRSNTPGIATPPRKIRAAGAPVLGRRALPARRLARLGATPDFHHGLLMDVAFSRQPLGGGGKLHFVRAAGDDAVAEADAAFQTDPIAITGRDLHVPACESLATDLNKDIWPARFKQHSRLRDRRPAKAV